MKIKFIILFSLTLSLAQASTERKRTKLIGNILKNALETYHYRSSKINDNLSEKAFKEYIKKIDYGKQFLLQEDVKGLSKYRKSMDDQMISGDHLLIKESMGLVTKRVKAIQKYMDEIFKKPFDFKLNEEVELDPDKRKFSMDEKGLKDHWRKTLKQATLSRFLTYKEEKEDLIKDEKEKKKNKKKVKGNELAKQKEKNSLKKMTDQQLLEKARVAIRKKYKKIFDRVLKDKQSDYLEKFFNSISMIFDPHTVYLPPKRKEDFDIDISGSLEGIGAVLQEDGPYIKVVKIVPGGAAWRQKELEVDDIILMVSQGSGEPVDLVDMRVDDAVRYIRGKKGTEVRLTVKKVDGTRKIIPIFRDVVHIGESYAKSSVLEHKKLNIKVGYIHVPKFYRNFEGDGRNCTDDVRVELERLKKKNVDGVILDLRNNGGGALEDAKQMSGLFIKKGPIVQVRNHRGEIDILRDKDTSVTFTGPLIVMINRFSASASEILAGAMQDYDRAVIVGGEYSHGKGTVQAVLNLNQGPLLSMFGPTMGALKVTIQKFYRVTGASTQFKGVTPDIILPDQFSYRKDREQDLDNSLPWDEIAPRKYETWKKYSYNLPLLRERSNKRVRQDARFKKVKESVDYLIKRREETKISLNLEKVKKDEENNKKMTQKLKIEKESMDILVSNYENSLKHADMIKKGDEKTWKEDFEQRKEEWVKGLRLNPGLEEAMFIMDDIIKGMKNKKLAVIPNVTGKK